MPLRPAVAASAVPAPRRPPARSGAPARLAARLLAAALACLPAVPALAEGTWESRLLAELARIDAQGPVRIGVYVRDLGTGASASFRGGDRWYLASTVKVPVAIAVLRGVERGQFNLDTALTVRAADYVDGAGSTNRRPVGAPVRVRQLLEQMVIHSDNTASDMLIHLVGAAEVNAVAEELAPGGIARITSLADVRRKIYGELTPQADRLAGRDLLLLKQQPTDADRLRLLARLTGTPADRFQRRSVDEAYRAYYAGGLNSGRLDAYGEMLARLAEGRALSPASTAYLLDLMERVATGTRRIRAGLPAQARFFHKTGTQRYRTCDSGIVQMPAAGDLPPRRAVLAACTEGEPSLASAEAALRQVGAAVCRSGLLNRGASDAPNCPAPGRAGGQPPAGGRAAAHADADAGAFGDAPDMPSADPAQPPAGAAAAAPAAGRRAGP